MIEAMGGIFPSPYRLETVHEEQGRGKVWGNWRDDLRPERRRRHKRERQNRRDGRRQRRRGGK